MFNEALDVLGSNVEIVRGKFESPTGKMAKRAGFSAVRVVSNNAGRVVVEFTK
jgi:hypothetical protein